MTTTPTVSKLDYRWRAHLLNLLAGIAETLGTDLGRIDADAILATARHRTGLTDFGDPGFEEPMRRVVAAVAAEPSFTPLSRVIQRQAWNQAAVHRLEIADYVARKPEVANIPVKRPIFVLGFPRTGTTLMQHLLAQHPDRRGLKLWELTHPVPKLPTPEAERDRAMRRMGWMLAAAYQLAPEMGEVHYVDANTLEECWYLFANSFAVLNWDLQSGLRPYGDWLTTEHDMAQAYREYRAYLQIRLEQFPAEQLVLKCPEHLWFLDDLLEVFPDACIVWTHRDPYPTIGSYCSLMSMQWRNLYGKVPLQRLGDHMSYRLLQGIDKALEARDRHGRERFFDVRFSELVADPIGISQRIHEHFDLGWDADDLARSEAWLADEREDTRGRHKYDPALYGLDRDDIHARYAHYIERMGISTQVPR